MQTPNVFERFLNKLNAMSDEQKLMGIAIMTGLFLLMVGTLVVVAVTGDSKKSSSSKNASVSTELVAYKPASTNIGSFPTVGACQVLNRQDIADSLGENFVPKPNQAHETYFHLDAPSMRTNATLKTEYTSVDDDQVNSPFTSSCTYESADGSSRQLIKIVVKQYPTNALKQANIKNASDFSSASPEDIAKLKQKLTTQLSAKTTKFLEQSAQSSKDYAAKYYDSSVDITKLLQGKTMLIEPGSKASSEAAIELYENNSVVSVEIVGGTQPRRYAEIPSKEYAAMLNGLAKVSEIIHAKFDKQELLSAPAPTAPVKTVPGSNNLNIVDACNVLSPDVFKNFTGAAENMPVVRTTFPMLTAADATEKVTNIHRSSNDCTRQYNPRATAFGYTFTPAENAYGASGNATVTVNVMHAKSSSLAENYIKNFRTGTKLSVTSGEAYRNNINPLLFTARKGQYAISVTTEKSFSNDKTRSSINKQFVPLPISDAEMSALANQLINNL